MRYSRRHFLTGLGLGFGSLVLSACPRGAATAAPRDALAPTPQIDDGDGAPPPPPPAACAATADNIEGPFYKKGAPSRAVLVTDRDPGERLALTGTVRSTACMPLARAVLDVWHADARGAYDNEGWGLRGALVTDEAGRWRLDTIIPGRYLNGRRYRPMHIHVKVRAPGHAELTTQLYFEGDEYIEGDPFVVSSLIMPHRKVRGGRRAAFDFVLA
jgi:protocatechuate 3,4-dioxygenase beta subunit